MQYNRRVHTNGPWPAGRLPERVAYASIGSAAEEHVVPRVEGGPRDGYAHRRADGYVDRAGATDGDNPHKELREEN